MRGVVGAPDVDAGRMDGEASMRVNATTTTATVVVAAATAATTTTTRAAYSRKDKSLGLLCENFLARYGDGSTDDVSLDDAATTLGVERRRIYDIVNVLESIDVMVRKAKNQYSWHGVRRLPESLKRLKESGLREFGMNFEHEREANKNESEGNSDNTSLERSEEDESKPMEKRNADSDGGAPGTTGSDKDAVRASSGEQRGAPSNFVGQGRFTVPEAQNDSRREKSLGLLSQKFVQLFLASKLNVVSLDTAARILLGDSQDDAKLKTKIRRLYDIANILCSLHLIQKVHLANSRKPAFLWLCRENSVAELIAQGKGLRWFDKPDADESVHKQKSHVGALGANEETTGAQANGKKQQKRSASKPSSTKPESKRPRGRPRLPGGDGKTVYPHLPRFDAVIPPERLESFNRLFAFTSAQLAQRYPLDLNTDLQKLIAQTTIGNSNFLHHLAQVSMAQAHAAHQLMATQTQTPSMTSNAASSVGTDLGAGAAPVVGPLPPFGAVMPVWGMSGMSYQNNSMQEMMQMYENSIDSWQQSGFENSREG